MFVFELIIIVFSLLIGLIYTTPRWLISFVSSNFPDVIFQFNISPSLKTLALTIDDFPNRTNLSISLDILDVLRKYNVRCTFFTIGSHIERHRFSKELEILFERIKIDGHELGNHGWRDEKAVNLSSTELQKQIENTQEIIQQFSFPKNQWFRPGCGFFNRSMIEICQRLGYRLVLGSIYPHDPIISNSTWNSFYIRLKLYSGGIIILHDRPATVQTLKFLLPNIQKCSFQLTTLTEIDRLEKENSNVSMDS